MDYGEGRLKSLISAFLILQLSTAWAANTSAAQYETILEYWPQTLLPSQSEDSSATQILTQTVGTLVRYEDNTIAPYLAESWSISKDQTTYIFHLRKDGRFSNGRPITVDEVILSIEESLKTQKEYKMDLAVIKGGRAFCSGRTHSISGIKKLSKYSLSITLEKPFAPLLDILTTPRFGVLLPEDIARLKKGKVVPFASSGPFTIASIIPNKRIELIPSPTYYERNKVSLSKLNYEIVSDPKKAQAGLASRKFHDIIPYTSKDLPQKATRLKKIPSLTAQSNYFIFSCKHPQLKNKALRIFIAQNLDIDSFLKKMNISTHQRAFGLIPRGMLGYSPDLCNRRVSPISLKETGCSEKHPCTLSLMTYGENNSQMRDALNSLVAPLNKFPHIKLHVDSIPMSEFFKRFQAGDYEIAMIPMKPDSRDTYMMLRHTLNEKLFAPGFDRREIKTLLHKARSTENFKERAECYRQVDAILQKHQIIAPLYHGDQGYQEAAHNVNGLSIPFLGYIYREYRSVSIGK